MNNVPRLRTRIAEQGLDAFLITDRANLRWISGFTGSFGYALISQDIAVFVTDSRYEVQAKEQVKDFEVRGFRNPKKAQDVIAEELERVKCTNLGFEPNMTYASYLMWKESLSVELISQPDLIPPLRAVKSESEITRIQAACGLADACLAHVVRMLRPGISEYDISLDIEFFIRRNGAEVAFSPIVVSGERSARPHGTPSERKLQVGDFVTLDLGAKLDGYCSDITRTFIIGSASDRHREIYEAVLAAQQAAIQGIRVGLTGKEVDRIARDVLAQSDLDHYFGHGLGHGLGLEVHDGGGLSPSSDMKIETAQVWTVEPGVYIEDFGGVRIEDDIVVRTDGAQVLTKFPKELLVLE